MQPDRNPSDWQQPDAQPAKAPYAPPPASPAPASAPAPVVTMTPDAPQDDPAPVEGPSPSPAVGTDGPAAAPGVSVPDPSEVQAARPTEEAAGTVPQLQEPLAPKVAEPPQEPIRWQANEYIHHEKSPIWFIGFGAVVLILIVFAILIIKSWTFGILIPVMAAALIVYSHRPPRVISYTLSSKGLHINDQLHPFSEFKSFGVIRDGQEYSVMLIPVKRFLPGVTIYFPEEAGEGIVDMLGTRLPMKELHLDFVDQVVRKLRI